MGDQGSPPHPRGIYKVKSEKRGFVRFTPASAGNIMDPVSIFLTPKVHPRIRGEYFPMLKRRIQNERFTPASAGNIPDTPYEFVFNRVHPRIRGEYFKPTNHILTTEGSPPHPRGISGTTPESAARYRFTPASAGNIAFFCRFLSQVTVHPRIRGEYRSCLLLIGHRSGSPPHPRGIY